MSEKKKYILRAQNALVVVDHDCYKAFYKLRRREKYLEESDEVHGKVSYHALDTEDYTGEEIIPDSSDSVEDIVVRKLMLEKLTMALDTLSEKERMLIDQLFFNNKSERQLAAQIGIPRMTICSRKKKILGKLKKVIER